MTQVEQDDIILKAALEFGADYLYEIRNGPLGLTLYVHVDDHREAKLIRQAFPPIYENLRTIVTYYNAPATET